MSCRTGGKGSALTNPGRLWTQTPAVNRTQSNFANRRLVFLDGFHRDGISRIPKTDSEATPKAAICAKAGDNKSIG